MTEKKRRESKIQYILVPVISKSIARKRVKLNTKMLVVWRIEIQRNIKIWWNSQKYFFFVCENVDVP